DLDQVKLIAEKLKSLGEEVDLSRHFGSVREWMLIGPFEAEAPPKKTAQIPGFAAVFPPETAIDLEREVPGKGSPVRWKEHRSADVFGTVDLNKVLVKQQSAVAYALARIESAGEKAVHIRAGSPNALKIWLNGRLIFEREEYHHGVSMDQHRAEGMLRP